MNGVCKVLQFCEGNDFVHQCLLFLFRSECAFNKSYMKLESCTADTKAVVREFEHAKFVQMVVQKGQDKPRCCTDKIRDSSVF